MVLQSDTKSNDRATRDVARLFSASLTEDEGRAIFARQSSDDRYRDEFLQLSKLCSDIDLLADSPGILREMESISERSHFRPVGWKKLAIAAMLLLSVALIPFIQSDFMSKGSDALKIDRYLTTVGEQKVINLDDGSVINLNTASEVLVSFQEESRLVTLVRGEAYFSVNKSAIRPFSVHVGQQSITVLGTTFNIRKDPGNIVVAVESGHVVVHGQEEKIDSRMAVSNASIDSGPRKLPAFQQYHLRTGEVSRFDVDTSSIEISSIPEGGRLSEWRSGMLTFDKVPLIDVVKELNRYSAKKILIEDSNLVNMPISAAININRISVTLTGLEISYDIKSRHYFDRIVLESKR